MTIQERSWYSYGPTNAKAGEGNSQSVRVKERQRVIADLYKIQVEVSCDGESGADAAL